MPDFWDLPRPVRDKIYRLHLVEDDPITETIHNRRCRDRKALRGRSHFRLKQMPPVLNVSARTDREAAPIYYGENHFIFDDMRVQMFTSQTMPRHLRLVRTITCEWRRETGYVAEGFRAIGRMIGLQELNIKLDEKDMVDMGLRKRDTRQRYATKDSYEHTAQEQLAIYLTKGMDALLQLRGLMRVNFLKLQGRHSEQEFGGPIEGGVLQTQVAPRIMAPRDPKKGKANKKKSKNSKAGASPFNFLGLPAELRNRLYEQLKIDGPVHLSKRPASSSGKDSQTADGSRASGSALALLGVNKQIRDEAVGIFYSSPLVFYYPTQFHACVMNLGLLRRSVIRDVTIYYDNVQRGGIDVVDLNFHLLRDLTGMRKLRIIMEGYLCNKIRARNLWSTGWTMNRANPALIPGLRVLFSLRGVSDIRVQDTDLEVMFQAAQKEANYPDFETQSRSYHVVKLTAALEHFNQALQDAQTGRVNTELLEDNKWHTWDEFPQLPEVEEEGDDDDAEDMNGVGWVVTGEAEYARRDEAVPAGLQDLVDAGTSGHPTLRRSARLSAKAAEFQEEEQHPEDEHPEEEQPGYKHPEDQHPEDAEDDEIGEEIVVYRRGRAASSEL